MASRIVTLHLIAYDRMKDLIARCGGTISDHTPESEELWKTLIAYGRVFPDDGYARDESEAFLRHMTVEQLHDQRRKEEGMEFDEFMQRRWRQEAENARRMT